MTSIQGFNIPDLRPKYATAPNPESNGEEEKKGCQTPALLLQGSDTEQTGDKVTEQRTREKRLTIGRS
jgi:hypothetical protein